MEQLINKFSNYDILAIVVIFAIFMIGVLSMMHKETSSKLIDKIPDFKKNKKHDD